MEVKSTQAKGRNKAGTNTGPGNESNEEGLVSLVLQPMLTCLRFFGFPIPSECDHLTPTPQADRTARRPSSPCEKAGRPKSQTGKNSCCFSTCLKRNKGRQTLEGGLAVFLNGKQSATDQRTHVVNEDNDVTQNAEASVQDHYAYKNDSITGARVPRFSDPITEDSITGSKVPTFSDQIPNVLQSSDSITTIPQCQNVEITDLDSDDVVSPHTYGSQGTVQPMAENPAELNESSISTLQENLNTAKPRAARRDRKNRNTKQKRDVLKATCRRCRVKRVFGRLIFGFNTSIFVMNLVRSISVSFNSVNVHVLASVVFILFFLSAFYVYVASFISMLKHLPGLMELLKTYDTVYIVNFDCRYLRRKVKYMVVVIIIVQIAACMTIVIGLHSFLPSLKTYLLTFGDLEGDGFYLAAVSYGVLMSLVIDTLSCLSLLLYLQSHVIIKEFCAVNEQLESLFTSWEDSFVDIKTSKNLHRFELRIKTARKLHQNSELLDSGKYNEDSKSQSVDCNRDRPQSVTPRGVDGLLELGALGPEHEMQAQSVRKEVHHQLQQNDHGTTLTLPHACEEISYSHQRKITLTNNNSDNTRNRDSGAGQTSAKHKQPLTENSGNVSIFHTACTPGESVAEHNINVLTEGFTNVNALNPTAKDDVKKHQEPPEIHEDNVKHRHDHLSLKRRIFHSNGKTDVKRQREQTLKDTRQDYVEDELCHSNFKDWTPNPTTDADGEDCPDQTPGEVYNGYVDEAVFDHLQAKHQILCSIVERAERCLVHFLSVAFVSGIPLFCMVIYGVRTSSFNTDEGIFLAFVILQQFGAIVVSIIVGICVKDSAHAAEGILYRADWSTFSASLFQKVQLFTHRLGHTHIGYQVYGLFAIDRSTILMLTGTLVTYTLVVVQL